MNTRPKTTVYMIRHAESIYIEGAERERGLTDKGSEDARLIRELLLGARIDAFVSSPYRRAIDTISPLAEAAGKEIAIEEDLRERQASATGFGKDAFMEAKRKLFDNPGFAYPGGESSIEAQERACRSLSRLIGQYRGQSLAVGTHGDIMTLMLNRYDSRFDYTFWTGTTMPDVYRLQFVDAGTLADVTRLWPQGPSCHLPKPLREADNADG
ncbi:histidine phosphatase family protein [Paenibacillus hodogayensis]|uniref:Histidine phosphatase family protein n=1 Tax=Paenibacillus hodogayensis TaxID=279208 RepID=A0ABV5VZ77_9BACL